MSNNKNILIVVVAIILFVTVLYLSGKIPKSNNQTAEISIPAANEEKVPDIENPPDSSQTTEAEVDSVEECKCEKVTSADIYTKRGEIMVRSIGSEGGQEVKYAYLCNLSDVIVKVGIKIDGTYVENGNVGDMETSSDDEEYYPVDSLTVYVKTHEAKKQWDKRMREALDTYLGPRGAVNVLPVFKNPPKAMSKEK